MHEYKQTDICPEGDISEELSCNYILSIQLSEEWFSYCILDKNTNRYIALSSYSLVEKKSKKQKEKNEGSYIEKLTSSFEWLKNPFKKVCIIYVNQRSEIVPSLLFDPSHKKEYLDFVVSSKDDETVYYDSLPKLNLYNVYSLPGTLEKQLKSIFMNCTIMHYSSTLLTNVFFKLVEKSVKTQLFLNVQLGTFDLIVSKGGELAYFNTFRLLSDDDLLYYLFYVIEQLKLDTNEVSVQLMGEVETGSVIHKNISKYIRDVAFIKRNVDFKYIDVFDDIPQHFFYNLLNANLCV